MINIKNPDTLGVPWNLSTRAEKNPVTISNKICEILKEPDVLALDFLHQSYLKKHDGAILNEDKGMNTALQVSSFLGALYKSQKINLLILVLSPDEHVTKWHYFMSKIGDFKVKIIDSQNCHDDCEEQNGTVVLLSFSNIKLAEFLKEYDFFSVIIDNFDSIATKLVIRRLQGSFNIGITQRNFYLNPEQKLQWTMLNWSNPGCVGKLSNFYEIDNDNFANFRDNYYHWWFRLTWSFCDTFEKPSKDESESLGQILKEWEKSNNLPKYFSFEEKPIRKRKIKNVNSDLSSQTEVKREKKVYKKHNKKLGYINSKSNSAKTHTETSNIESFDSDSNDTIIYENDFKSTTVDESVDSMEVDEPPIAASSSDEDILYSLTITDKNDKISCRKRKENNDNNDETKIEDGCEKNLDESDIFLKSVGTNSENSYFGKNKKITEKFFNTIFENTDETMENIKYENSTVLGPDVESESDGFFKNVFKEKRVKLVASNGTNLSGDIDKLVEEALKMAKT